MKTEGLREIPEKSLPKRPMSGVDPRLTRHPDQNVFRLIHKATNNLIGRLQWLRLPLGIKFGKQGASKTRIQSRIDFLHLRGGNPFYFRGKSSPRSMRKLKIDLLPKTQKLHLFLRHGKHNFKAFRIANLANDRRCCDVGSSIRLSEYRPAPSRQLPTAFSVDCHILGTWRQYET